MRFFTPVFLLLSFFPSLMGCKGSPAAQQVRVGMGHFLLPGKLYGVNPKLVTDGEGIATAPYSRALLAYRMGSIPPNGSVT